MSLYFLKPIQLFVFLSLLFYGCSSEKKSKELLFLENVMIRESGLYVLMGAKPMSIFDVHSGLPETEEEYRESYPRYVEYLKMAHPKRDIPSYQEYKDSYEEDDHLHVAGLWKNWESKMHEYVGPHYQFIVRKTSSEESSLIGFFVNTCSMLYVLTHYALEFEQINGAPFNPKQVLKELPDENSLFWKRVLCNDYSKGLLFGYGPRNSFAFEWQSENNLHFPMQFFQEIEPILKKDVSVLDLRLPSICMYSLGDPVLNSYKAQRREILAEFLNKDFETTVKEWLGVGLSFKKD